MKQHRFFIKEKIEDKEVITLTDRDILHQWKRVLRFLAGQRVILLDNTGTEFHGVISEISVDKADINKEKINFPESYEQVIPSVKLYPALIKKDKFDWVLQKCTEIGVNAFHPIISDRTEKTGFNMIRAEKILTEASEQSERRTIPRITVPQNLDETLQDILEKKSLSDIYLALQIKGLSLKDILSDILEKKSLSDIYLKDINFHIFVGPEGGWSEDDTEIFNNNGVQLVSVGSPILRAETASVVISTLLILGQ